MGHILTTCSYTFSTVNLHLLSVSYSLSNRYTSYIIAQSRHLYKRHVCLYGKNTIQAEDKEGEV